jgi:poly-gamma-glutamate capsule biosynthesis protein CapA/YwtB (metallophosphatase superfamily)
VRASKKEKITVVLGGDVDYARMRGERLLRETERDDLVPLKAMMEAADVRFLNLESTISDRYREQRGKMVFTAPPLAAEALARARIDIVSVANNHAWDFEEDGLMQTFGNLQRVRIAWVGAGKTRAEAYAPRMVESGGWRIAFVAVTAAWNQEWDPHPGKERVADAVRDPLVAAVRQARADGADRVIVSQHGGEEYVDAPHEDTRALALAALEAGADVFVGHHPHVVQRAAFAGGKPVFYSLGNLLMRMVTGKPWTEYGMLARVTFADGAETRVEVCPYRLFGLDPVPLVKGKDRAAHQTMFRTKFEALLAGAGFASGETAARLGKLGSDGCAPLEPAKH